MPKKEEKEALVDIGKDGTTVRTGNPDVEHGEMSPSIGSLSKDDENGVSGGDLQKSADESMVGEEKEATWNKVCPTFGVRSYLHQFYAPQPVKNPGLYEFPQVNMGIPSNAEDKQRKISYRNIFTVIITAGLLLSIISGVILSLQYFAPYIWLQMIEEFRGVEMWTLTGFLAGVLVIMTAVLIRLLLMRRHRSHEGNGTTRICEKDDTFQTPGPQGNIPLIKEIQAIQPPQESIMSHMQ